MIKPKRHAKRRKKQNAKRFLIACRKYDSVLVQTIKDLNYTMELNKEGFTFTRPDGAEVKIGHDGEVNHSDHDVKGMIDDIQEAFLLAEEESGYSEHLGKLKA